MTTTLSHYMPIGNLPLSYLLTSLFAFCENNNLPSLYNHNKPKSHKHFTAEYQCNDKNSCINRIELSLMTFEKDSINLLLVIYFRQTDYSDEGNISQVCLTRNVNDFLLYIKSKSFENELSEKIKSNMNIYISRK